MAVDVDADGEDGLARREIDELGGVLFLVGDDELGWGGSCEKEEAKREDGSFHGQSIGQAMVGVREKWASKSCLKFLWRAQGTQAQQGVRNSCMGMGELNYAGIAN